MSEKRVANHTQYQDSHQVASDWLSLMKERLAMCSDVSGDKHTLTNKLDRVQVILKFIYMSLYIFFRYCIFILF